MHPVYLSEPLFYFQDFGSTLLSLFWILFQVECLFPLHSFYLIDFYYVPSSAACLSVFSFCLIYCVWSLLSSGWKVVVPLNCGVCLLWVELRQCLVKFSWMGGLVPAFWWMDLGLVFLEGSAMSSGVLWDTYWLGMASLFEGLIWGSWHWNFLAFGWTLVLVLRWRPLGGL